MTSKQIVDLLRSQEIDLILPLGACEQHGHHLPLSTDQIIAEELAVRVADVVGDAVIAPSIPVGVSGHHLRFGGTATIAPSTYIDQITDIISSFALHGFRTTYLVTGHAGNCGSMQTITEKYTDDEVVSFDDWPIQRAIIHEVAEDLGLDPETVGTHAGHFETSIILLLRPDLVNEQFYQAGFIGPSSEASAKLQSSGMHTLSEIGVIGDPTGATAHAGELYLNALVGHVVDGVRNHRSSSDRESAK